MPGERIVSVKINRTEVGLPLLSFLCQRFKYHTPKEWLKRINDGLIKLNANPSTADKILSENDIISYDITKFKEPDVDANFAILSEDENFLIIDKSGNLPVHPAGPFFKNTLWWMLRQKYDSIHIMTRLDRETSGILAVAKNPSAAAKFAEINKKGLVEKKYTAIVFGNFPNGEFLASGKLSQHDNSIVKKRLYFEGKLSPLDDNYHNEIKKNAVSGRSDAQTIFKKLSEKNGISIIEAKLISGKTHQIRATLSSLSYPIVGDKLYGVNDSLYIKFIAKTLSDEDYKKLGGTRQFLHSSQIRFTDIKGKPLEFFSEIPNDMRQFLSSL